MRLLLLLLMTLGCMPTVYIHTDSPEEHSAEIRDAGRHIGVRTRIAPESAKGVIDLEFRSEEEGVCGQALEKLVDVESPSQAFTEGVIDCQPKAWSCPGSAIFLGHELGHTLGLTHVESEKDRKRWGVESGTDNIMDPSPTGSSVSKRQRIVVQGAAVLMSEACR